MTRSSLPLAALPLLLAVGCGGAAPAIAPGTPAETTASVAMDAPAAEPGYAPPAPPPAAMAEESGGMAPSAAPAAVAAAPRAVAGESARKSSMDVATSRPAPSPIAVEPSASPVKAGEWDDNANYREFQKWLATVDGLGFQRADVRDRQFVVVRDAQGKSIPNCPVTVSDAQQHQATLTTLPTGRALLFPHAEGLSGKELFATANCKGGTASARLSLDQTDGVIDLKLSAQRTLPATRDVDVAFILDSTGSMSEEIAAVKSTIQKVASALPANEFRIRVGLVEFKDRTDTPLTRVYPFTGNVADFSRQVAGVSADGGGDIPEDVNQGLHDGLTKLAWNKDAVARFAFLIGDAPPHLDYANGPRYVDDMRDAAHRGIQVFTVAASGMDDLGQVVWRQIAQYTGATNLFVMRGGAGPQSTGAGDPKSSCGGTQTNYASGNLDELIVQKIKRELRGLERDPMKIAGLRVDENAKPCNERVLLLAD